VLKGRVKAHGASLVTLVLTTEDVERAKAGPIIVGTRGPAPGGVGLPDGPDILIVVSDAGDALAGVLRAAGAEPIDDETP
jgi:hypothetical protein